MRVLLLRVIVALSAAGLVMACASGGDGDDPLASANDETDSGASMQGDSAGNKTTEPTRDGGAKTQGSDGGKTSTPDDAGPSEDTAVPPSMDASSPMMEASSPTKDAAPSKDAAAPPPDAGSSSDECDTSNPIYAIEAAAEIADGDEILCVTGCS